MGDAKSKAFYLNRHKQNTRKKKNRKKVKQKAKGKKGKGDQKCRRMKR